MTDSFDIIRALLPDIDLKFRIEKVGRKNIQLILCREILMSLYTPIINTLKDKNNIVTLDTIDDSWCFNITFGNEDNARKFAEDYLSQKSIDASKIAVVDNKTGEIVCAGLVRGMKHNDPAHEDLMLISLDGMFYFHLDDNPKYHLIWYNGKNVNFANPYDYSITQWSKSPDTDPTTVDVYRDYSYNELDPEVSPIVHAMNKIPGLYTTGSCCGHNIRSLYVAFSVSTISAINFLKDCLSNENSGYYGMFYLELPTEHRMARNSVPKRDFTLEGKPIIMESMLNADHPKDIAQMTLLSKNCGEQAYKAANLFAKDICKNLGVKND